MPKWLKFAGLWSLSALAALALSWVAVSQVRDRVIQPVAVIPTTLAQNDVDRGVVVIEPVQESDSGDDVVSTPSPSFPSTTSPGVGATTTTRAPSRSPSTSTSTSTTIPASTTTVPPVNASGGLASSSYTLSGGSVTIRSAPGEVYFVSAIPAPGFTTELRDVGPDRVRVRFVGPSLVSEFEAEWDDGQLDISSDDHSPDD